MIIQENIPLAPYTVFKIGGQARYFCEAQSVDDVRKAVLFANNHNVPIFILGAGSNLLVSDEGYRGLVIKMNLRGLSTNKNIIYAEAGASMAQVVNFSINQGLGGFEWGVGVPGTIGGSVFGNAGCFEREMKDIVESVSVLEFPISNFQFSTNDQGINYLNTENSLKNKNCKLKVIEFSNADCKFAYRDSIFKKNTQWIILSAILRLFQQTQEESRKLVLKYSQKKIIEQDIGSKCAGCIFKNPARPAGGFITTGALGPTIAAGLLIDQAGLKGVSIGGAMVSKKHANFIINMGSATALNIKELIAAIKSKVKLFHGVELEEEIRYLG